MLCVYFAHVVSLFHDLGFEIRSALVHVLGKSCCLGCFCAHDNLNRFPFNLFLLFLLLLTFCFNIMSSSKEKVVMSWEKSLLFLGILNRKIKHFVNLLFICKPIKLQPLQDLFLQHNPNQRNNGSVYLTSLMAHIQSFEVLSTKCVWPFDFILIDIQLAQSKLNSWALCCQAQPFLGSHICWNINHLHLMTLKHFLKSSMLVLNIQTKNTCLASSYGIFVKDNIQLGCMH